MKYQTYTTEVKVQQLKISELTNTRILNTFKNNNMNVTKHLQFVKKHNSPRNPFFSQTQ